MPLRRSLGKPRKPFYQRLVLAAAFALLNSAGKAFIADLGDVLADSVDSLLAWPLPPRDDLTSIPPSLKRAGCAPGGNAR